MSLNCNTGLIISHLVSRVSGCNQTGLGVASSCTSKAQMVTFALQSGAVWGTGFPRKDWAKKTPWKARTFPKECSKPPVLAAWSTPHISSHPPSGRLLLGSSCTEGTPSGCSPSCFFEPLLFAPMPECTGASHFITARMTMEMKHLDLLGKNGVAISCYHWQVTWDFILISGTVL